MLALSGQILDVMVVILLAVVGALVLWLHFKLHRLRSSEKKILSLSEDLTESLNKANRGLFEFSRLVREEGPKLEKEVFNAGQTVQDLDFMLAKAEKLLKRMDNAFDMSESVIGKIDTTIKSSEKETLLNQSPKSGSAQSITKTSPKRVKGLAVKENIQKVKKALNESNLSEADIEKKLERELLTGLLSDVQTKSEVKETSREAPKRMASPMLGAMAYGGQGSNSSNTGTDAEKELLKALEGRL